MLKLYVLVALCMHFTSLFIENKGELCAFFEFVVFLNAVGGELGWAGCSLCDQADAVDIGCAGCHHHAFP